MFDEPAYTGQQLDFDGNLHEVTIKIATLKQGDLFTWGREHPVSNPGQSAGGNPCIQVTD